MSRYSIFGEKSIVAKSQWVKIYGTDDNTFTYNDKRILTSSDLPPPFSVAPLGSTPNTAGLSYAGGVLNGQPADATHPGFLTSGAQSIGGNKTFNGNIGSLGSINAGTALTAGTTLAVTGTSNFADLATFQNGETVTGPVTLNSVYGLTPNTTAPKLLTIGSTGVVNNFTPVVDLALVSLVNGSASTNPASPSVIGISSIQETNTGISIDTVTNSIQMTKPGVYLMQFQLQLTDPGSGNLPVIYTQMQGATSSAGPWSQSQSYENAMMPRFTGVEQPYIAPFVWRKHTPESTSDYLRFVALGNCYPSAPYSTTAAGVAPGYITGLIYINFIASPTTY